MSFINKMFGAGKKEKTQTTQEAIQNLRATEDLLMKKSEHFETKIETEIALAKKHGIKNKKLALSALKRKRKLEEDYERNQNTLLKIENQREALENSTTNNEVLRVMTDASKALKNAHKGMDVEKVNNVMDDIADQKDIADEISQAITSPIGGGIEIDDDDLLKELEEMEQQVLDEKLVNITPVSNKQPELVPDMPSVPSTSPTLQTQSEKDDLKQLQEWAS